VHLVLLPAGMCTSSCCRWACAPAGREGRLPAAAPHRSRATSTVDLGECGVPVQRLRLCRHCHFRRKEGRGVFRAPRAVERERESLTGVVLDLKDHRRVCITKTTCHIFLHIYNVSYIFAYFGNQRGIRRSTINCIYWAI
jgi:hypothetical protein